MQISAVIAKLEELKAKHGDVRVDTRHQESNELYSYPVFTEVDSVEFGVNEDGKQVVIIS